MILEKASAVKEALFPLRYEWLNHAIFVGTLGGPRGNELKQGEKPFVIVGVYKLL